MFTENSIGGDCHSLNARVAACRQAIFSGEKAGAIELWCILSPPGRKGEVLEEEPLFSTYGKGKIGDM